MKTALLNIEIDEEIYDCQPQGWKEMKNAETVHPLRKTLYGLKQAFCKWYHCMKLFLPGSEFQARIPDPSLFISNSSKRQNGSK